MRSLPNNPFIPAYRIILSNTCHLVFRCPYCDSRHLHGCGDGKLEQWRVSHCIHEKSELRCRNIRLLCVGEVASERMLPRFGLADLIEFNRVFGALKK
ncbi:hypothetical protein [Rhodoplanes sp. Z2-YC6860]|uniref:hypothetical protein n=1 Tax=Rhodoplanes sp. Z2-YC6860 TaxID=674703 RepID=UPI0012ED7CAD|nr:hypothetical protein [Rhodoplanes sp. Z2-YC6860]